MLKKHNHLLNSKILRGQTNQNKDQANPRFEASSVMSSSVRGIGILRLVRFLVSSPVERYSEETIALHDNGSTVSYIDVKISEKFKFLGQVKMSVSSICWSSSAEGGGKGMEDDVHVIK